MPSPRIPVRALLPVAEPVDRVEELDFSLRAKNDPYEFFWPVVGNALKYLIM